MSWIIDDFSFNKILVKDHASMRMLYRNISQSELYEIIEQGEVIEDYPNDFPYPSKLIFKFVNSRPFHLVLAYNKTELQGIVVTIYEASKEYFEEDFKTRKSKL